jgi:hypothetical protein
MHWAKTTARSAASVVVPDDAPACDVPDDPQAALSETTAVRSTAANNDFFMSGRMPVRRFRAGDQSG